MLSMYMIWISIGAFILGGICCGIIYLNKSLSLKIIGLLFFGVSMISGLGALVEKEVALSTSSTKYYYTMLEKKSFIEAEIKSHKKEIQALHNGNVEGIVFKNKNEMINLDNAIKHYNRIILQHLEYKDNYWHKERYNEAIAKLKPFEDIF